MISGLVFKMLSVKKPHFMRLFTLIAALFCHISVSAEVLVDPTRPPSHRLPAKTSIGINAAPKWVLSSTLIAPARRLATINGKTVSIGQRIGTAKVISIEPSQVALKEGNKKIVLHLLPNGIKRTR